MQASWPCTPLSGLQSITCCVPSRPIPAAHDDTGTVRAGSAPANSRRPRQSDVHRGRCARTVSYPVARVYWLYDVPGGEKRGGRAHRHTHEFVIALSGSFDVVIDEGRDRRIVQLNRSYMGLHLPAMTWRSLENFSTNSVCLVLASRPFDESDVVRRYPDSDWALKMATEARNTAISRA